MKKTLLFIWLALLNAMAFAQSNTFTNINYTAEIVELYSSADIDWATQDDIVMRVWIDGEGTGCLYWQCDAPCYQPYNKAYIRNNVSHSSNLNVFIEGHESSTSDYCTFYPSSDYLHEADWVNITDGGYVANDNRQQGIWKYNNAPGGGEFVGLEHYKFKYRLIWRYSRGETFQEPIEFGSLGLSQSLQEYGNNITGEQPGTLSWRNDAGTPSPDVYYSFYLEQASQVTLSTDNLLRTFDTQLTLFDESGNQVAFDDDGGTQLDGYGSIIQKPLSPGLYIVRVEGYESQTGNFNLQINVGNEVSTYQQNFGNVTVNATFPVRASCANDGTRVFDHFPAANEVQAIFENTSGYFVMPKSETTQYNVDLGWGANGGTLQVFTGDPTNGIDPAAGTTYNSFGNCSLASACKSVNFTPDKVGANAAQHYAQIMTFIKRNDAGNIEWVAMLPIYITGIQGQVRGSTLTPNMPTMVLHDPPGDQSYAAMTSEHDVCQGFSVEYATDETNNLWGTVKLGVEGSIGFIVEADYSVYAQATGTMEMAVNSTNGAEQQMCYRTTSSKATGTDGAPDDVFIGTSIKYLYGFWYNLTYDNNTCQASGVRDMLMAPDKSVLPAVFFRSESAIRNIDIPELNQKIAQHCGNPDDPECIASRRQLYVWNQALANNDAIKANAPVQGSQLFEFDGGGSNAKEAVTITSNQQQFIETHVSVETGWAVEAGAEIAGSGVSGGGGMKMRVGMGQGINNSFSTSNTIEYLLQDSDAGDYFATKLYRDPVFGTPVFKLDESLNTRTSCPYEGGIPLDNPKISLTNGGGTSTTIQGAPGGVASTQVNLFNDSPQERTYLVKLDANSNPNGARVSMAGVLLNGNDLGQQFSIPANGTLANQLIEVQQNIGGTITNFPGLEIYIYPECEPSIRTSVFVSANFATPPVNDLACNATTIPANGVVQTGFSNNAATTTPTEQALAPIPTDCVTSWCENGGNVITNSVWFKFTAPSSGAVSISTCNMANFDTQLALYSGSDCNNPGSFSLIAANDDGPLSCATEYDSYMEVSNLMPGTTYYLLVDGWTGSVGNFDIVVTPIGASAVQERPTSLVNLQVNPNPNAGSFNVTIQGLEMEAVVSISDLLGRVIFEQTIAAQQENLSVNLGKTAPGQYLLSVKNSRVQQTRSFIIAQ